ncbi:D-alanyl-D-alanine carboxypeptidase/D-alanyl-D-alanine endopeptidase [Rhodoferax fermentans]|uniref:D-alanyl-D-alanine carboxypeptidase/D-alanyl-D-alanine-endopeptidase n=1 Tax=Rhodoferax fermentans TaxID=28066 RepID=A0A1T1AS56_RHOFE|nr:D-alanyl-D-alanine carboxypeptidase/D-alanyl-D-alanine-endopeptidase [Rhodoferax fermentans]MBK1682170.1 D-alanyl-D-alanine carboxypeptidase/D-alanyl-D-alanine-endopeptidase [Rhodoferax fermentans]OOV06805.1 D-alanyl-D-alanine carboxypeptidase/D-alanyl-D-alanine-endopeptidase [Rhodoferax fermentans]
MTRPPSLCRHQLARCLLPLWLGLSALVAGAQALPEPISSALARAQLPPDAISLLVVDANGLSAPRLSHRAEVLVNPASVMKLVTTTAALDLLGPAYTWRTPVWLDGPVVNGVLKGNLVIAGQGDPALTLEKLWLLLRRVQGLGVQRIAGDIVLDRSAFAPPISQPGDFDGEPLRPYNASPEALLVNFKSILMTFTPDPANRVARVQIDPPLAGVQMPSSVPLLGSASADGCGDYRGGLQADFSDPTRIRLAGGYPMGCGEKLWPVAYIDPPSYAARAIEGLWRNQGGKLDGRVLDGRAPATSPSFWVSSPTLAEVIRDINKFSNNVMAQQLFLTLARQADASSPASFEAAREVLRGWWQRRIALAGTATQALAVPQIENGAGLSRQARISAAALGRMLQVAYLSPYMPELMASLPLVGLDGTLKRSRAALASAHLKTGSLRDVQAVAGYVHGSNGRHLTLVAIVNHPNAAAARPVLEAVVDWAAAEAGTSGNTTLGR